jgi:hypothetical protein
MRPARTIGPGSASRMTWARFAQWESKGGPGSVGGKSLEPYDDPDPPLRFPLREQEWCAFLLRSVYLKGAASAEMGRRIVGVNSRIAVTASTASHRDG